RFRSRSRLSPRGPASAWRWPGSAWAVCRRRPPRPLRLPRSRCRRWRLPHRGLRDAMLRSLRTARGVMRSLGVYYGSRKQAAARARLSGGSARPGVLVSEAGAQAGAGVAAFRRLGASVVAVEPQPALVMTLRMLYGRHADVTIVPKAVGRTAGRIEMMINV